MHEHLAQAVVDPVVLYESVGPEPVAAAVWPTSTLEGCDVIVLGGELCTVSAGRVAAHLMRWLDSSRARHLHLDLDRITLIDGRGISLLVRLTERASGNGQTFDVQQPPAAVRRLLQICELRDLISDDRGVGIRRARTQSSTVPLRFGPALVRTRSSTRVS